MNFNYLFTNKILRILQIKKMDRDKIILSGITGTSAMTLFSYWLSESKNENFSEPEILSQLIKKFPPGFTKTQADIAGWCTHYAIGTGFALMFNEIWKVSKTKPSIPSGALLGALSGLAGIAAWQIIFAVHPNPPAKNLKKYFGHLLIAHIVFGIFSTIPYKLKNKE